MWRKRSIKHRYWNVLKRLRLVPGIAALALTGCASHAPPTSSPPGSASESMTARPAALEHEPEPFDPQWWPTELQLSPELQSDCRPLVELPARLVLNDEQEQADQLEPLVACLTMGFTKAPRVHLAGETELPGALPFPTQASGRADALRSTLATLGVPFETIETHGVDSGRVIEVGIDPTKS